MTSKSKSVPCEVSLTAAVLCDVQREHASVMSSRALKLTTEKLFKRVLNEGMSFLTKTLPALGKAFDRCLVTEQPMEWDRTAFSASLQDPYPQFLGEIFSLVLSANGSVLENPSVSAIRSIRQVLYLWYKYELPYSSADEQKVVTAFEKADDELVELRSTFSLLEEWMRFAESKPYEYRAALKDFRVLQCGRPMWDVIRDAKNSLNALFSGVDWKDINPKHGPGSVSTKEQFIGKYQWINVSKRITDLYPFDEYFCSSGGHVCDTYKSWHKVTDYSFPARVCLVPKDSRGPRLISCEPVDNQWIQQGLRAKIYEVVESHALTRYNIHFTDQRPNQLAALWGSQPGRPYVTLDLKEASDRVSLRLVHLLFPDGMMPYLECCRSLSTMLPDGREIWLEKFAPMGSALCFPVMALTIWALLNAAAPDQSARESILVYGDDVVVEERMLQDTITILEYVGLKINVDKSCTSGFFRESCGVDAYKGEDVTPLKLKTVWSLTPCPNSFPAWVAYANSAEEKKLYMLHDAIVKMLDSLYWPIASLEQRNSPVRLKYVHLVQSKETPGRIHKGLQTLQWKCLEVSPEKVRYNPRGWEMLLRFFAESGSTSYHVAEDWDDAGQEVGFRTPLAVSVYTKRNASKLVARWR